MKIPSEIPLYGDPKWRGKCPLETVEQVSWFNRIRREYPDTYGAVATHIRNEGLREAGQFSSVIKHSAEGLVPGASDIIVPVRIPFICEMKRVDASKSVLSPEQVKYLLAAQAMGAWVCVALGAVAAWQAFEQWRVDTYQADV